MCRMVCSDSLLTFRLNPSVNEVPSMMTNDFCSAVMVWNIRRVHGGSSVSQRSVMIERQEK